MQYLMLGDRYSDGSICLVSFLNHVAMERWFHVETVVKGKMRESMNLSPLEINLEVNETTEAASTAEAETLPQPSSTEPFGSAKYSSC